MKSALDLLLARPARNVQAKPEEKDVEIRRLTLEAPKPEDGSEREPVVFRVRALTYNQVAELRNREDMDLQICLSGIVGPDLGSVELARHFGVLNADEQWGARGMDRGDLLKAMLLSGEISELAGVIQKMSGYLKKTVFEVKKN